MNPETLNTCSLLVKKWRAAYDLENKKAPDEEIRERAYKLILEELLEADKVKTRKGLRDLYADLVFFCLSALQEGGCSITFYKGFGSGCTFDEPYCKNKYMSAAGSLTWTFLAQGRLGRMYSDTEISFADMLVDILRMVVAICGRVISESMFLKDFTLVYENNMKKYWTNAEVQKALGFEVHLFDSIFDQRTNNQYTKKNNIQNKWIVKDARGKVLKPPGFKEVKL